MARINVFPCIFRASDGFAPDFAPSSGESSTNCSGGDGLRWSAPGVILGQEPDRPDRAAPRTTALPRAHRGRLGSAKH